ncbi:response regulator [Roseomonas sp. KE2513]|uniref:PAS domain-containing hybrid sensor histidine kinase/response regulator n=1 Tax=Roseomonas sp. KE2513 TaxID=2479202 RepID=UPI0018DFF59E|nr:PAS domain-containing hybrid sensor histidine kinase/response regulator [Roseomonas sp. KE2513]MBI0536543.1 response regulator [Roseomonas sp. KE2513]
MARAGARPAEAGTDPAALRAALAEARAEAARLAARLRTAERQVSAGRALASARRAAAEEDDAALGAALEELSAFSAELEDANAALAREVAERRAELVAIDAALRESEERVRLAHRYAGAGAWDWHIPHGTMTWSDEYRELLGLPAEAAASYDAWLAGVHAEDRAAVERELRGFLSTTASECEIEYRVRHPHRGILWLSGRGRLHRDDWGTPLRLVGLCIDITARKRAEIALRDANENLRREVEREVAAREAAQARLTQTLKLEALGRLTGGVAHDFNNLLAVVTAGASLLARAEDPARRAKLTANISAAAARGADLTRRLLTFARRQALRPERVALAPWLREIGALLSRSLRADIAVEVDAPDTLWPVLADPSEMELAVTNLALNAQDAMPRAGVLRIAARNVTLAGTEEPEGLHGDFLRLEVSDTGTGMSPEALARAFEPFFTTKSGGGGGLGLPQVYGFARQSGGAARVGSRLGQGTCVTLLLPRAETVPDAAGSAGAARRGVRERTLRVLVVEDDEAVASLVLDMMQHLGHSALRASSAADALHQIAAGIEVDLVFTDVLMPGEMDGLDLARTVAKARPGLPVLLTSGYGGAPARVAEAGLPLLRKPYDLGALRRALAEAAAD